MKKGNSYHKRPWLPGYKYDRKTVRLGSVHTNPFSNENGAVLLRFV